MTKSTKITVNAKRYEDAEDCLTAAAADVAAEYGIDGYDLEPRWVGGDDGERDEIELTIPAWAVKT